MNPSNPESSGPQENWQPLQPARPKAGSQPADEVDLVDAILLPDDGSEADSSRNAAQTPVGEAVHSEAEPEIAVAVLADAPVGDGSTAAVAERDSRARPGGSPWQEAGIVASHPGDGNRYRAKSGNGATVLSDAELALQTQTANGGAVTAVFLGCWSILFSFLSYLSIINALLGLGFAIWGLSSGKRRLAMVGLGLNLLGLLLTLCHDMLR